MKKLFQYIVMFCFVFSGCTSMRTVNPAVEKPLDEQNPALEESDLPNLIQEEDTTATFELTVYTKEPYVTYKTSEKDTSLLEDIFDFDEMEQTVGPPESPCAYLFCRGEITYTLSDTLDFVSARLGEETFYGKELSEKEMYTIKRLIINYAGE